MLFIIAIVSACFTLVNTIELIAGTSKHFVIVSPTILILATWTSCFPLAVTVLCVYSFITLAFATQQ